MEENLYAHAVCCNCVLSVHNSSDLQYECTYDYHVQGYIKNHYLLMKFYLNIKF